MSNNNNNSKNRQEILSTYNVPAYLTFESNLTNVKIINSPTVNITASDYVINHKEESFLKGIYSDSICLSYDGVTTMVNASYEVKKVTKKGFKKRAKSKPVGVGFGSAKLLNPQGKRKKYK